MRKIILFIEILCLALTAMAGFRAKTVKPKKPERFQTRMTLDGVTVAADLLLDGKDQKKVFYKELTPYNLFVVRLAIFNESKNEVLMPLEGIRLFDPGGEAVPAVSPEVVAQAVLQGFVVHAGAEERPVQVQAGDPRIDRTSPAYDPRLDPTHPEYDPSDPRNRTYGAGTYNRNPWLKPGVDVVLNPGAGRESAASAQLIERDFINKSYTADPIVPSFSRDKFLYFSLQDCPTSPKGFELHLPSGKGIARSMVLKF